MVLLDSLINGLSEFHTAHRGAYTSPLLSFPFSFSSPPSTIVWMSLSPARCRIRVDLLTPPVLLTSLSITVDHRSSLSMIPQAIETRAIHVRALVQNDIYHYVIASVMSHSFADNLPYMYVHIQAPFRITWRTSTSRPVIFAELVIPRT